MKRSNHSDHLCSSTGLEVWQHNKNAVSLHGMCRVKNLGVIVGETMYILRFFDKERHLSDTENFLEGN
jgi:hypothetical protein